MKRGILLASFLVSLGCKSDKSDTSEPPPLPREEAPAAEPATPEPDATKAPAARPLYYEREITAAELEGRSLKELSIMRNTIFARAGHSFRKKWLRDYFTAQPWYRPLPEMDESKITPTDRANARLIAEKEASFTREELERRLTSVSPEDEVERRLLSSRLGKWVGGDDVPLSERSPLEDPSLLDKLLTAAQLEDLSLRDLRILRNAVYARHGKIFKSELLNEYFQSTDWYEPNEGFTDALLTSVDRKNVRLIRSVEDSLGGPLSDRDHRKEDGWFSGA